MPLVDMPIEKLLEFKGRNPKPKDFDEFWDKSIAEMKAMDSNVTITPADFKSDVADCYDMYFTGVNGSRIYTKFLKPKNINGKCPAIILFHGYSGNGGAWMEKLSYVASGFCVFAMDCRGQGGKSQDLGGTTGNTLSGQIIRGLDDEPEKLLFRNIYLDTAQLAGIVLDMDEVDENRVGVHGGSQGGALTIACAALEPRIKMAAPVFPFLCDYKRVWEMDLAAAAYEDLKSYFRNFDPRHEREDEIFEKLGYIDLQHLAPRIKAELLMFTGLMDTICPPSTQFAAYNKMTCKKKYILYPDFGHEGLPDVSDITYEFMMGL